MARGKRGHDEVDTYEEDDFVENDDGSAPKKKTKKGAASKSAQAIEEKSWEVRPMILKLADASDWSFI